MREISVPNDVQELLEAGAAHAVSISGGKDSQALLSLAAVLHEEHDWPGPLVAVHADLGRAEWPETPGHVASICEEVGVELVVVRREKGDLVDRWRDRMEQLEGTDKPFWSSAANRYCTSDLKRAPINKYLRSFDRVVCSTGLRAAESRARSRKEPWRVRTRITGKALRDLGTGKALAAQEEASRTPRYALTWRPLLGWSDEDVWAACGTDRFELERRRHLYGLGLEEDALEGWPAHPAYVYGNTRLSCALCVLASRSDLENGARHNPDLLAELAQMERESGCSFRQDVSLVELERSVGAREAA